MFMFFSELLSAHETSKRVRQRFSTSLLTATRSLAHPRVGGDYCVEGVE